MPTAAANPVFGEGGAVSVDDGANSAFVDFADVIQATPPDAAVIEVDRNRISVTTMKERAFSSRLDPGEMSITYECDDATFERMELLKNVSHSYRYTAADGLRFAFTGRLKTNQKQGMVGEQINTAVATVRATSLITLSDTV